MTYNGWTNRETWAVADHIDNKEELYEAKVAIANAGGGWREMSEHLAAQPASVSGPYSSEYMDRMEREGRLFEPPLSWAIEARNVAELDEWVRDAIDDDGEHARNNMWANKETT